MRLALLVPIVLSCGAAAAWTLRRPAVERPFEAAEPLGHAPVDSEVAPREAPALMPRVEARTTVAQAADEGGPRPALETRTMQAREIALERATLAMERATAVPWEETIAAAERPRPSFDLTGTYVVVRLEDPDGRPWSGPPPKHVSDRTLNGICLPRNWEGGPVVRVVPCSSADEPPADRGDALQGHHLDDGSFGVPLIAGRRYLVSVLGAAFSPVPQVVDVPEEGGRVDLAVRSLGPRELGTVRVHVALPPGLHGWRNLRVRLEDPATGALVHQAPWESKRDFDFELRAPPGQFRLAVLGQPWHDRHHATLAREREVGRAELQLTLGEGEHIDVVLEPDRGAYLDLALDGLPDASDRAAVRERWGEPFTQGEREREERCIALASVELRGPGGRREPVGLERPDGWFQSSTVVRAEWPLGGQALSEVVSAGTWTLVARLPGGRELRREVVLREGEVTPVRLEFGSGGR